MDNLSGQEVRAIQSAAILRQPLHKFIAAKRRERSVQGGGDVESFESTYVGGTDGAGLRPDPWKG
ncbi:MAG: hypothetical protein CCU26_02865 [Nitrospira sp. UW-LDO-01]|nr:MAG: hypothetical protein CCU26_02865 [Nitrospira sp. UW-LDO-01]